MKFFCSSPYSYAGRKGQGGGKKEKHKSLWDSGGGGRREGGEQTYGINTL